MTRICFSECEPGDTYGRVCHVAECASGCTADDPAVERECGCLTNSRGGGVRCDEHWGRWARGVLMRDREEALREVAAAREGAPRRTRLAMAIARKDSA